MMMRGCRSEGKSFGIRLDTHGGRFAEGLDYEKSVETVGQWLGVQGEYNIVEQVLGGTARSSSTPTTSWSTRCAASSSARACRRLPSSMCRRALDAAGYRQATIVGSSGFDPQKCQIMGAARRPLDVVGTGSFLPATLTETYATADIIAYDGVKRVKVGREFLYDDK